MGAVYCSMSKRTPFWPDSLATRAASLELARMVEKSPNQSSLDHWSFDGVVSMRRKLYLNFLKGVAFRLSMAGWSSSMVKVRLLQQSHMKLSGLPPPPDFFDSAINTTP